MPRPSTGAVVISIASRCYSNSSSLLSRAPLQLCRDLYSVTMLFQRIPPARTVVTTCCRDLYSVTMLFQLGMRHYGASAQTLVVISIASRCYSDSSTVRSAARACSCRDLYSVTMLFRPHRLSLLPIGIARRDLYSVTMLFQRRAPHECQAGPERS